MFHRRKTYLALYEVKNDLNPFYHLDFTTRRSSKPPKVTDFILRTGFTGRIIIFEVKEVLDGICLPPSLLERELKIGRESKSRVRG